MTILGKILVFINLVFSLAIGGLVVMVYMTRTNYSFELEKERKKLTALEASTQTYKEDVKREKARGDDELNATRATLQKVQEDVAALADRATRAEAARLLAEQKAISQEAIATAAQAEVQRRQLDVEQLRATLKLEMDKSTQLTKQVNEEKEKAAQATITASTLKDINTRLEAQLQEKTRDLVRIRANMGATLVSSAPGGKNPPPENVEGLIKTTDPSSGLVKISLGSDAGLKRGHTMELYRLSSVPSQSKYLGTIKIIEVTAKEAVAQPMTRLADTPQPGDQVSSRIFGS